MKTIHDFIYRYDYFIKDYTSTMLCTSLGNVRVVLTEEDATTETKFLATLEEAYRQLEISNFDNIEETVENIPIEYPVDGSVELNEKIAMLSAENGTDIGPSIVLPVKRGDKVSLETEYFYSEDDQGETYDNFGLLVNEVLLSLAASGAGVLKLTEGQLVDIATGSGEYGAALSDFMSSNFDTTDVTRPHAYLIWTLYDNTMKLLPQGSGVLRVTDPNELERLLREETPIIEDGYLHAYVANKSSKPMIFDNILVTLLRGKTRQINHYYPYGLSISGIGGDYDEYLNKYIGKELQTGEFDPNVSTGLEMFDFHARFYDPQVGRWFTPDPAEQFHNPYLAMGNNPVMYVDPDGRTVEEIAWDPHHADDWGLMSSGDGGIQDESTMWNNLIYSGGAPSNNHWGNGFRSKEYNEVFLTRKTYYELYGYDHINMFDVDRSDKEEVWNKALALSVTYEQKWRILQILRKPNGSIFGVYGDHVWEPVWSPFGTPENDNRYGSPYKKLEPPLIPGPYEGPGSNWANFKAIGSSLDSFLHGAEGFETIMYLTKQSLNVALSKKASGMMMTRDLSPKIPGATMFPFNTPGLELILQGSYIGPYNNNYQVPYY